MPETLINREIEGQYEMNLLTNQEAVLDAMASIEALGEEGVLDQDSGDLWLLQQAKSLERKRESNPNFDHQLAGALERIKQIHDEYPDVSELPDYERNLTVATIYGIDKGNRWSVQADGSIYFSAHHCSNDKIIDEAKRLGFRIE